MEKESSGGAAEEQLSAEICRDNRSCLSEAACRQPVARRELSLNI